MANKVYNDLKESPFTYEMDGFLLTFSSVFHRNKYKKEIKSYIKNESLKFKNRYKVNDDLKDVFIIAFYKKVENRGFMVFRDNLLLSEDKAYKNIIL